jgi:hypothetical protein
MSVAISCAINRYMIGDMISGLVGRSHADRSR